MNQERPPFRSIAFIGPPGAGKSTQISLLSERLGKRALLASVPRLVRKEPDLTALLTCSELAALEGGLLLAREAREAGELAPLIFDELLFSAISQAGPDVFVLLDGCPRGLAQARLFLDTRAAEQTLIVELYFDGDTRARSFERQLEREINRRGLAAALKRSIVFRRKTEVFLGDTRAGLRLLHERGLPCLRLSADLPETDLQARILEALTPRAVLHRSEALA